MTFGQISTFKPVFFSAEYVCRFVCPVHTYFRVSRSVALFYANFLSPRSHFDLLHINSLIRRSE